MNEAWAHQLAMWHLLLAMGIRNAWDLGALGMERVAIAFHVVWLGLETFAAVYPDPTY